MIAAAPAGRIPASPSLPLPAEIVWRTPLALIARNAAAAPNRLALVAPAARGGEARLSAAALAFAVDRAADALREAGLRRGEHLAVLMTNAAAAEYVQVAFGAMRLGAVVVPLNTRLAPPELRHALEDMDCRFLVHETALAGVVEAVAAAGGPGFAGRRIAVGPGGDWEARHAAGQPRRGGFPEVGEGDLADILLTSGTTGRPKGVMLTHGNAVATGIAIAGSLGLGPQDTYQSPFPLFTSSGFHFNLMAALWSGATMVIEPAVDIPATLARITRERTTVYCAVPSVYIYMLDRYDPAAHDLSSLRVFDYGGAAMAREVIRRLAETFPGVELRQTYGLTEAGPTGTFLPGEDALRKLGSLGRAMPLCEVRVLRPDGSEAAPGEAGEIAMRGPAVAQGYYRGPEATAATFRDGWLWSGDLGQRDDEGYLYYLDRLKDVIIRGGYNIASMEVENAVFEHPGVREVAVVAMPHPALGEDLCAFVVAQEGQAPPAVADLRAFVAARIADYKVPRTWVFLPDLPRNPTGKVLKAALREQAAPVQGKSGMPPAQSTDKKEEEERQ